MRSSSTGSRRRPVCAAFASPPKAGASSRAVPDRRNAAFLIAAPVRFARTMPEVVQAAALTLGKYWRSLLESNPCFSLERDATSANTPDARLLCCGAVDNALRRHHDAIVLERRLDRDDTIQHIIRHLRRIALQRIAVAAAGRAVAHE